MSVGTVDIIFSVLPAGMAMSVELIIKRETQFVILISLKKEVLDSIVKNEIQRQAELALKESDKDEILKAADRRKEVQRRCAEADQQIERLQKRACSSSEVQKRRRMRIM